MSIKKWVIQYVITVIVLFFIFAVIQYLKGKNLVYSLEFGAVWSVISASIFLITRATYFKKNIACQVCNDLHPDSLKQPKEKE